MIPEVQIIFDGRLVHRTPPDNYKSVDAHLYYPEDFRVQTRDVHAAIVSNAVIAHLILYDGFKALESYCRHRPTKPVTILKSYLKRLFFPQTSIDRGYTALNEWGTNYFHWLTEVLPCLILCRSNFSSYRVLLPDHYQNYLFIIQGLQVFGIEPNYYSLRQVVVARQLAAVNTQIVAQFNPDLITNFKSEIERRIVPPTKAGRRIYISRRKAQRRKISNEHQVVDFLTSLDFEAVCMEDLSFPDQVRLMQETRILISCHGGGLTNLMFMPEKSCVYELKASNNDFNCFFALSRIFNMGYYYQLCDFDDENHRISNITVDLEQLKNNLLPIVNTYLSV